MKKTIYFISLLIIFFCFSVSADLTDSQAKEVATFARNLVDKGIHNPHIDDQGMPLIVYKQGPPRVYGYQEKMSFIDHDFRGGIVINKDKWAFDCASFTSYVLKKTLDITLLDSGYLGGNPYMVNKYETDRTHFKSIGIDDNNTSGMTGQTLLNLKNSLKEGDLIIVVGKHIAMYVGNNEVAESTPGYIGEYGKVANLYQGDGKYNLGIGITNFDYFVNENVSKDRKFMVLRIRDGIVSPNYVPNTTLIWPDTGMVENLGTIKEVKKNDTFIKLILSPTNYTQKLTLKIDVSNEDGLKAISIGKDKKGNYQEINNLKNYQIDYDIKENGKYYIDVKDINGKISNQVMDINNLDTNPPVISKLEYINGQIFVTASDDKTLLDDLIYSLNNGVFGKERSFSVKRDGRYQVSVRDLAGNTITQEIDVKIDNNNNNIETENISPYLTILVILIIILMCILVYQKFYVKRKR